MGKLRKIALLSGVTLASLALAVFVLAPAGLTYLAEVAKFAPTVVVALVVYAKSHDAERRVRAQARRCGDCPANRCVDCPGK